MPGACVASAEDRRESLWYDVCVRVVAHPDAPIADRPENLDRRGRNVTVPQQLAGRHDKRNMLCGLLIGAKVDSWADGIEYRSVGSAECLVTTRRTLRLRSSVGRIRVSCFVGRTNVYVAALPLRRWEISPSGEVCAVCVELRRAP